MPATARASEDVENHGEAEESSRAVKRDLIIAFVTKQAEITAAARSLAKKVSDGILQLRTGSRVHGLPVSAGYTRPRSHYPQEGNAPFNFLLWRAAYAEFYSTDCLWRISAPRNLTRRWTISGSVRGVSGRSRREISGD